MKEDGGGEGEGTVLDEDPELVLPFQNLWPSLVIRCECYHLPSQQTLVKGGQGLLLAVSPVCSSEKVRTEPPAEFMAKFLPKFDVRAAPRLALPSATSIIWGHAKAQGLLALRSIVI